MRRSAFVLVTVLGLPLTLLAAPARASGSATVTGAVVARTTGAPVAGAAVVAISKTADGESDSATTASDGSYSLALSPGTYQLVTDIQAPSPYVGSDSVADDPPVLVTVTDGATAQVPLTVRTILDLTQATGERTVPASEHLTVPITMVAADGSQPSGELRVIDHMTTLASVTLSGGENDIDLGRRPPGTYEIAWAYNDPESRYILREATLTGDVPNPLHFHHDYSGEPDDRPRAPDALIVHVPRTGKPPAWLAQLNRYRAQTRLPSVDEDPILSAELKRHTSWMSKNVTLSHPEKVGTTGFSYVGDEAGRSSDLYMLETGARAIRGWWNAPFHRSLLFSDNIYAVGYAETGAFAGLMCDCWVDHADRPAPFPLVWPARGAVISTSRWTGSEIPDPIAICHWPPTTDAGVPISVDFGPDVTDPVRARLLDNGRPVRTCALNSGTTIMPYRALRPGHRYTAIFTSGAKRVRWQFRVAANAL